MCLQYNIVEGIGQNLYYFWWFPRLFSLLKSYLAQSIMAEKITRKRPLTNVTAAERAKQFPRDLYADNDILFCRFCVHSLDFTRLDTVKDHMKSKKHVKQYDLAKRQAQGRPAGSGNVRQATLNTVFAGTKSKTAREDFVLDFTKLCTVADIPLDKVEKMRPFIKKHCTQGGTLPQVNTLREVYVPRLFVKHFEALKEIVKDAPVCVIADETTDIRDKSILNVVVGVRGSYYLLDVVTLEACNHATFSESVIKAVTGAGISFQNVIAVVSDSAAYCKKAFRDVLAAVFPSAVHVLCLAHIINLVGDIFQKWNEFGRIATLVSMIKSAFFKKPGRKSRYLKYIAQYLPKDQVKLPPVPVSTRWNTWFNAVIYHTTHIHLYEGFFEAEASKGIAVETILELVKHRTIYKDEILPYLYFISENCQRVMHSLTALEATHDPLAASVFNTMENLTLYLTAGTTKNEFGAETDRLLATFDLEKRRKMVKTFQAVFQAGLTKLSGHVQNHPALQYYKAARIFDPRQLAMLPTRKITDYGAVHQLNAPTPALLEEWEMYSNLPAGDIPAEPVNLVLFWESMKCRFPNLSKIAADSLWMPVSSVDVERSFSLYKHILNDRRESLSPENTKKLIMLYYNGDIEKRF